MNQYDLLLKAVEMSDVRQIRELASGGLDINHRLDINSQCDDGASVLFSAVLHGNVEVVRALLELGANPNFEATEPALSIYADTPLNVAIQARNLMDWEKFDPIVHLLIKHGASGYSIEPDKESVIRQKSLDWQQNGKVWETPKAKKSAWRKFFFVSLLVVLALPSGIFFHQSSMPYMPVVVTVGLALWLYVAYWLLGMFLHPVLGWFLIALTIAPLLWWLYKPRKKPKKKT